MRVVGLSRMPPRPWNRSSGPSRLSQSSCVQHLAVPSPTFLSFAPPSETQTGLRRPSLLAFPHRVPKHPPLSSQPIQTASLGVVQRLPFRRTSSVSPLPAACSRKNLLPSAGYRQVPNTFRPCRSSRLRRFTPHRTPQVYCTLHPAMGFEPFPSAPPFGHFAAPDCPRGSPRLAIHTLQSLSLVHSRTASPQPLPPRRHPGAFPLPANHRSDSHSSFQPVNQLPTPVSPPALLTAPPSPRPRGLAPCPSPLLQYRVSTTHSPMLSWALFPFRALPSTAVSLGWTPRQALPPAQQAAPSAPPALTVCRSTQTAAGSSGPASL